MNRTIRSVFAWVIPPGIDGDAMLGDLEEEYAEHVAASGRMRAAAWLASQMLRSAAPLLRARITSPSFRRSTLAVALGFGAWAAGFALLTAASVLLFRVIDVAPGVRVLAYLGVAFVAAANAGSVVRRSQPGGTTTTVALTALVIGAVTVIFIASPEDESLATWIVWATIMSLGVLAGGHRNNQKLWRTAG